ncbi:MAG: DoxX-like family protein, partial [Glaciimonas sp.]|nr:DoxX-like family protein [Glaciimonas sp.]
AASILDGVIGLALLFYPRRWLWPVQIVLVASYTIIMSFCLPEFWLHPFGMLNKNLPLLAMMAVMWRITGKEK